MTKKPYTLVISDEALKDVPPEDRERVRAELQEAFKDFDPDNMPENMRAVCEIPEGVFHCPECVVALRKIRTLTLASGAGGETVDLLECPSCETPYERQAANLPRLGRPRGPRQARPSRGWPGSLREGPRVPSRALRREEPHPRAVRLRLPALPRPSRPHLHVPGRPIPMVNEEVIDTVVERLNKLIETPEVRADLQSLIEDRTPVSDVTGQHPDIECEDRRHQFWLGFLGMLNGVMGSIPDGQPMAGWAPIMAVYDPNGKLSHFRKTVLATGTVYRRETR